MTIATYNIDDIDEAWEKTTHAHSYFRLCVHWTDLNDLLSSSFAMTL